ncbi:MAG: hypothetical protein RLZZ292_67 [Bacteroidota bacterium]|jgi:Uma2 family endonuclease
MVAFPEKKSIKKLPSYLIYEVMDGKPIYYRGYQGVLKAKTKVETIMGSSAIQAYIISILYEHLVFNIPKIYRLMTGEMGIHLATGSNFSLDMAIYEKSYFIKNPPNDKYTTHPPKVVIEIDTKADFTDSDEEVYYQSKTQKLLDAGVEQIIWFYTKNQKVMISKRGEKRWIISDWSEEVTIFEHTFSLKQLLEEEGIDIEKLKNNLTN